MADPLSIAASVAGIISGAVALTRLTIETSKAVIDLVSSIREAPQEIQTVGKDVHAFYSVVSSLEIALKDGDIRNTIENDKAMIDLVGNLTAPLSNCRGLLGELMVKLQKLLRSNSDGKVLSVSSFKWAFMNRGEIRTLQIRLEAMKSTFGSALDAIVTVCSMRLLASSRLNAAQLTRWASTSTTDSIISTDKAIEAPSIPNLKIANATTKIASSVGTSIGGIDTKALLKPHKQIAKSLISFVDETRHAFMSENKALHQNLARIYRGIGERLRSIAERPQATRMEARAMKTDSRTVRRESLDKDLVTEDSGTRGNDLSAIDVFLHCVSRFSETQSSLSSDQLCANFSGSPTYQFESRSSYFPEQYSAQSLIDERLFVCAIVESQDYSRPRRYFILYAETPRRWQRIILSATFESEHKKSVASNDEASVDLEYTSMVLPSPLQCLLKSLLPHMQLYNSVTRVTISLGANESGSMVIKSPGICIDEDLLEIEQSDEQQILQDMEDMGCSRLEESDVVVQSRYSTSRYQVWVKSQAGVEQKLPFATAGEKDRGTQIRDFLNDLKLHCALRGCEGVAQLIGIVVDDTKTHLRSYISENPPIAHLSFLMVHMNAKLQKISWPMREQWGRQIIQAVLEVHSRGLIIGMLGLGQVGIRANGTIALNPFSSASVARNVFGEMPLELRETFEKNNHILPEMLNFRTDIFQLGHVLWCLTEHTTSITDLCARHACTASPRYSCTAEHKNPVGLPTSHGEVPSFWNNIIQQCRSADPRDRPSARRLMDFLNRNQKEKGTWKTNYDDAAHCLMTSSEMKKLCTIYSQNNNCFLVRCDECYGNAMEYYHCKVCGRGHFDLCLTCHDDRGIRCPGGSEHRMMRRLLKSDGVIVESS
ncbi:MAG: hypothetical protein Q9227_009043 [Pyrenula ochraceoflavens]